MRKRTVITAALVTFALVGGLAIYLITASSGDHESRALRKPTRTPTATATAATATTSAGNQKLLTVLAQQYVDAINRNDDVAVAALNCSRHAPGLLQIAANGQPVRLTGEVEYSPSGERAYIQLTIGGLPGPQLTIEKRDGAWCVRD